MKRNFFLSCIVAAVITFMMVSNNKGNFAIPEDKLVVFSQEGCPHCHDALTFIETTVRPTFPNIGVDVRDVANKNNLKQLLKIVQERKLNPNAIGTPIILIGKSIFVGWNPTTQENLMKALYDFTGTTPPENNDNQTPLNGDEIPVTGE